MECHEISGIMGHSPLLREIAGLGLFLGLRPIRKHTLTHKDACSLSFLKVRGTLDNS